MASIATASVADSPYLVVLALCEQGGRRLMPLAGRSQQVVAAGGEVPEVLGHALALELVLRVWQRSDDGALSRAAASSSLLLVELPMDALPELRDHGKRYRGGRRPPPLPPPAPAAKPNVVKKDLRKLIGAGDDDATAGTARVRSLAKS